MLELSRVLGGKVDDLHGAVVGRLVDLAFDADSGGAAVTALVVRVRGSHVVSIPWAAVRTFDAGRITVDAVPSVGADALPPHWLRRDVLDTQVIDVAGVRAGRVAEIYLDARDSGLLVTGVDLGARGVLRRLGFKSWAQRLPEEFVQWADLHLTLRRGHTLQLSGSGAPVHRLDPAQIAAIVEDLPTRHAAAVLQSLPDPAAADALRRTAPRFATQLLAAIPPETAPRLVGEMPIDDAVAVLRHCSADRLEQLLAAVGTQRAVELRRLLEHRPHTAGGLMDPAVRTATIGEPVGEIRRRLAQSPPAPSDITVVFVVDADGHPVGSYEPPDLLGDVATPRPARVVSTRAAVERAIDLLALYDATALAVVDDDGVLVGAIGTDDVLEELLLEHLPGRSRYRGLRGLGRAIARSRAGRARTRRRRSTS